MRIFAKHIHKSDTPYDHAPLWVFEFYILWERQMAAIDDLNNSITALGSAVSALNTKVDALIAAGTPNAAIEAAKGNVDAVTASVTAEAAKLP